MTPQEHAALDQSVSTLREATRRALAILDQHPPSAPAERP
jgi:hypothetical protein